MVFLQWNYFWLLILFVTIIKIVVIVVIIIIVSTSFLSVLSCPVVWISSIVERQYINIFFALIRIYSIHYVVVEQVNRGSAETEILLKRYNFLTARM